MSVRLAKKTGFCFGVKRAVGMAEDALARKKRPIYSLGSIIHNDQVVAGLSKKGLKVIKNINDIKKGVLVISSHGLSPKITASIRMRGIDIIDTTCPFVLKAQRIAGASNIKGRIVVIVGDKHHPEVRALVDFAGRKAFVVKNRKQAMTLKLGKADKVSVISQTTQSKKNFIDVVKAIALKKPGTLEVFDTICADAESRQAKASELSRQVGVMIVVGGRKSANTKRLLGICAENAGGKAHLIETESEIKSGWFSPGSAIGVTSGASTPDWMVEKVVDRISNIQKAQTKK